MSPSTWNSRRYLGYYHNMLGHFFDYICSILYSEDMKVDQLLENAMGNVYKELPEGFGGLQTVTKNYY